MSVAEGIIYLISALSLKIEQWEQSFYTPGDAEAVTGRRLCVGSVYTYCSASDTSR